MSLREAHPYAREMRHCFLTMMIACTACGSSPSAQDAGGSDAGSSDGGTFDASTFDASTLDASTFDASTFDASTLDASTLDASTLDASTLDASSDAGELDASLPPALAWDWEWINRQPQGNTLYDAVMSTPTDGWAVGARGTIVRYHAGAWTVMSIPFYDSLRVVASSGPDDAWTFADTAYHWDGAAWTVASTPDESFYDAWAAASDFVVGVGDRGARRWDGASWTTLDTGVASGTSLYGVHGIGRDDFWIVGAEAIVHCVGSACTATSTPGDNWNCVFAISATEAYVASDASHVMRWDGDGWSDVSIPALGGGYVTTLYASGPNDVWIATPSVAVSNASGSWSVDSRLSRDAFHIAGSGSGLIAAGYGLFHTEGSTLVADAPDHIHTTLNVIWGPSSTDLWLGMIGSPGVLRWNGTDFVTPDPSIAYVRTTSLHGTGSDDVWLVGPDGAATHWDGSTATNIAVGAQLYGVYALEHDHAIAVGNGGIIVDLSGTTATVTHVDPPVALNAVWAASPDDVYAVGDSGTILHYASGTWSSMTSGVTDSLRAVRGSGSDVYVAGDNGVVLHLAGGAWTPITSTANGTFYSLAFEGANVWLVGSQRSTGQGEIWRYDGAGLVEQHPGTSGWFNSIWALPDGEMWIAGFRSQVLRRPAH